MKVIYVILAIAGWAWTLILIMAWLMARARSRIQARGFDVVNKGEDRG